MKIVGDDFQWTDKTKSPWVGHTTDGTNIDKSDPVRLVSPRTKKRKVVQNQGDTLFHQSKLVRDRGVVSNGWVQRSNITSVSLRHLPPLDSLTPHHIPTIHRRLQPDPETP